MSQILHQIINLVTIFKQPEGEGWALFNVPADIATAKEEDWLTCGIESIDEAHIFLDDEAAYEAVGRQSGEHHKLAIQIHDLCNGLRTKHWSASWLRSPPTLDPEVIRKRPDVQKLTQVDHNPYRYFCISTEGLRFTGTLPEIERWLNTNRRPQVNIHDECTIWAQLPTGPCFRIDTRDIPDFDFDDDTQLAVAIQKHFPFHRVTVERVTKTTRTLA